MLELENRLDLLLQEELEAGRCKGASALILKGKQKIYAREVGFADVKRGRLMKQDTIIRLYSMTKPITAAAIMLLAERGKLQLQDPVSRYLPAFAHQTVWVDGRGSVPAVRENTVWDLLNMTSGIPYPNQDNEPGRQMDELFRRLFDRRMEHSVTTTRQAVDAIAGVPLVFQPGERWMYGLSADVLGCVAEAVSGMRYGEFLKKELFDPLGMEDTGFFVQEEKRCRFAENYSWNQKRVLVPFHESHLGEYYGKDGRFESGGAGLVSTLHDYAVFAEMLLNAGSWQGRQILRSETVSLMTRNHLTKAQRETVSRASERGYGYGCLMRVLMEPELAGLQIEPGEYGWDGWTGNYVSVSPKEQLILLYFVQACGTGTAPVILKMKKVMRDCL